MAAEEQARFISLTPPIPRDAGEQYLAFLQEELSERGKSNSLLAVYATKQRMRITLWTFIASDQLQAEGEELEAVHDAEVKTKAGYFTRSRDRPAFSIRAMAIPTKGQSIQELESLHLAGEQEVVRIFPKP